MRRLVGVLGMLLFLGVGAAGAARVWQLAGSTYDRVTSVAHIAPGLTPHLTADDAEQITVDYLNAQSFNLAAPNLHVAPLVTGAWAVTADAAAGLDGCIPEGMGTGIVWVTKGRGDYLNLADRPWSHSSAGMATDPRAACSMPARAGTIVIDDATGEILGVYPDSGAALPHPTPRSSAAASPPSGGSTGSPASSPSSGTTPSSAASSPAASPSPRASGAGG